MQIRLDHADPSLAEWWFKDRQDPETLKYNPLAPSTIEDLRQRLSKSSSSLGNFEKAESYFWSVNVDNRIIGHVTMQNINKMMLTAEIGYGVTRDERDQDLASKAVRLLAQNVFSQTPIRKLIAFVHEGNLPSRRVLEKVGFQLEGLLREHYLINGAAVNEAIYGLLREDLQES